MIALSIIVGCTVIAVTLDMCTKEIVKAIRGL